VENIIIKNWIVYSYTYIQSS